MNRYQARLTEPLCSSTCLGSRAPLLLERARASSRSCARPSAHRSTTTQPATVRRSSPKPSTFALHDLVDSLEGEGVLLREFTDRHAIEVGGGDFRVPVSL